MNPLDFFKAMSDDTRFNIMMLLAQYQELCVCDLTEKLVLSQPKISRHLALLRSAKMLTDRRQGQWVYYRLHPELPTWALNMMTELTELEQFKVSNTERAAKSNCCE